MAIPASQIVKINPRVVQAGGTDLVLNGMFLTSAKDTSVSGAANQTYLVPAGGVVGFNTPESVAVFFGDDSDEAKAAEVYFMGYNNSFKKPRQIWFGCRVKDAAEAWLRGAKYTGTLDDLKAVSAGKLRLKINNTTVNATGISLSSVSTPSAAATAITSALDTALSGTKCIYSSRTGAFQIIAPGSSGESTIDYCISFSGDGGLAKLLKLTAEDGAMLSQGSPEMSVAENMRSIRKATENWATFTTITESTASESPAYKEALECAAWAASQGVEYLYVCWSTADNLKNSNKTEDSASIAHLLDETNAGATTLVYGDLRYAAFIMGEAASIDWDRTQGSINFAFKSLDGLAPVVDDVNEAANLLEKTCNLYGTYATRNDKFVWLYDGNMFGQYHYIDPFVNAIWLNNALQLAIMIGLQNTPRVPYNYDGYTRIRAWCQDPILRALNNGVIDPGVELTEAQKAELIREAGMDIVSILETDGYYLSIKGAGPHTRTHRDTPQCDLWYAYGGSVNRIELASTLFI